MTATAADVHQVALAMAAAMAGAAVPAVATGPTTFLQTVEAAGIATFAGDTPAERRAEAEQMAALLEDRFVRSTPTDAGFTRWRGVR